jgi:hypothetical protein
VRACYVGLLIMGPVPRLVLRASAVVVTLTVLLVGAIFATDARASVSIAVTWDGLLKESSAAALVTSMEARPVWENGRIYTYTHVRVDRAVAGELASGGDAWIRTMGGIVGKVGQIVEGEASFAPGESSLLFVHPGPVGAFVVTARGARGSLGAGVRGGQRRGSARRPRLLPDDDLRPASGLLAGRRSMRARRFRAAMRVARTSGENPAGLLEQRVH